MQNEELIKACKELEHYVTDEWTVKAILEKEIFTHRVLDPCVGTGVCAKFAKLAGYETAGIDIRDWGYPETKIGNFLKMTKASFIGIDEFSVLMNPPFSLAEEFVQKSFELGARKVACFQRFSWYEGSYDSGKQRGKFWENNRPARIWLCGDRATCWRYDLDQNRNPETGDVMDYTGKKLSASSTSHAWFVWERGHIPAAVTGQIYKTSEKSKKC